MFCLIFSLLISNSLGIVVPSDSWHRIRTYKNPQAVQEEVEGRILTNEVPCLIKFLGQNLPSNRLPIIIPSTQISQNTEYFLKNLQLEMSIFVLREKFNSSRNYNGSLNMILLLDDTSLVEEITSNLVYMCSQNCVYVSIVTKFYKNIDNFMKEAEELVQLLWKRRIANVAIVSLVGNSVQLAKSVSFKKNILREPSTPELFGSCKETNGWNKDKEKIFSPLAISGSVAKVAFFEANPFTVIPDDDNETVVGIEGELFQVVSDSLEIELITEEISWNSDTDDLTEIRKKLNSNESFDIVIGGLQWAPTWDVDYTFPYKVAKIVWLIPTESNLSLEGLIAPFEYNVWYAILAILILTVFLKSSFLRDISLLDVFALIIGTSTTEQPVKLASRIEYLSWSIFSFFLSQSYLAALSGVLVQEANEQIETMEELISDGIKYGGTRRLRELFALTDSKYDNVANDLSNSAVIKTIYDNFVVLNYEKYLQQLQELINGHSDEMALVAMLNFSTTDDNFDIKKVSQLKEPLSSYPLSFAVWKGLPYLDEIERKIMSLTEGGFVGFWESHYVLGDDDDLEQDLLSDAVLGLAQLAPGFLLLVIGLFFSIVALFGEIMIDGFRKRQLIKERVKVMALRWRKKTKKNQILRKKMKGARMQKRVKIRIK